MRARPSARPLAVAALALATVAACGPRGTAAPAAGPPRPAALVVVAPSSVALDRTIEILAPLSGARLGVLGFGVGERWPTATFAARGLRADAPIGLAATDEGVAIRWATVRDPDRIAATLDGLPGAARWQSDAGPMWRVGADVVTIAGGQVAVVSGGAPSRRDGTALELAAGAIAITAPPADSLRLEVDGGLLIDLLAPDPGPILTQLGDDLGRVAATLTVDPTAVTLTVEARPRAGTLAERFVAHAGGPGMMRPEGPFAITSHLAPADTLAILTELGARAGIDVPTLTAASPDGGVHLLEGTLSVAPGAVSFVLTDRDLTAVLEHQLYPRAKSNNQNVLLLGAEPGTGGRGGVQVAPQSFAILPPWPDDPPELPVLDDDNTDVPWSEDYREARAAFEAARDTVDKAVSRRVGARYDVRRDFDGALGDAVAAQLVPTDDGGYRGTTTWRPPTGTIEATIARARAVLEPLALLDREVAQLHDAAAAARQRALEIRAHDVAAWDREHAHR